MSNIWNCGCGGGRVDDDEVRIIREIEEDEKPLLIPATPDEEEAIPAPDVFTRVPKREEVVVE